MGRPSTAVFVCTESFFTEEDGAPLPIREGDRVRGTDWRVRRYPEYFQPADFDLPVVEQATAAPGEVRVR